jgi:hypothetical protein
MRRKLGLRGCAGLFALAGLMTAVLLSVGSVALASGNAGYTTAVDDGTGNPAGCLDSPNGVNCNNYDSKDAVYMNGGPTNGSGLDDGNYYFAVLVPGSQHDGFIDGHTGNLSSPYDSWQNREFSVAGGAITANLGTHLDGVDVQGNPVIQLSPYDDTPNVGGVYILAICKVGATKPSDCKFDAFRINSSQTGNEDLTVSKTVSPSYTRTFGWTISKTVDGKSSVSYTPMGTTTTLTYVVNLTKGAGSDSAWDATGSITVTNPNDFDVAGVHLSDHILNDSNAVCTVEDGSGNVVDSTTDETIPANSAVDFSYDCSWGSATPASTTGETNEASISWDETAYTTPDGSASFDKAFSWGNPTSLVHNSVNLSDVYTTTPSTLPSGFGYVLQQGDSLPGVGPYSSSQTFTYHTIVTVPHGCLTLNNTATFTATDDSSVTGNASATAQICRTAPRTGALTMGFWQNKNGQAIISGQAKTGTCPSTSWLRQLAPFQDLGSTSTCSQVATYVYNVVKAANASGAAMNAMLKAQMLATALDVYFSDPTLGGNKINAPKPIGGVVIDLKNICKMNDNTLTGSGTCSGSYEDASSAFGAASSLTVSQMLAFAASQSNAGGTSWYGQNKTIQGYAKDAFDAINNQTAFTP